MINKATNILAIIVCIVGLGVISYNNIKTSSNDFFPLLWVILCTSILAYVKGNKASELISKIIDKRKDV